MEKHPEMERAFVSLAKLPNLQVSGKLTKLSKNKLGEILNLNLSRDSAKVAQEAHYL